MVNFYLQSLNFKEEPDNVTGEYDNIVNENDEKSTNVEIDAEASVKKCLEEFMVDDPTQVAAQPSEIESQEESHLYRCSECNIKFPSIQGHIKNCHKGQEVVFQVCSKLNLSIKMFTIIYSYV